MRSFLWPSECAARELDSGVCVCAQVYVRLAYFINGSYDLTFRVFPRAFPMKPAISAPKLKPIT